MTRFVPALLTAIICTLCVVRAVENIRQLLRPPDAVFEGPAVFLFEAPATDEFTLWHLVSASDEGEFVVREADLPIGTRIKISGQGQTIPTIADTTTTTTSSHGQRKSVLRFTAQHGVKYQIEVSGFADKRSFVVTHGPIVKPLFIAMAWIGTGCVSALATLVLVILAATNVFPKKPIRVS